MTRPVQGERLGERLVLVDSHETDNDSGAGQGYRTD